MNNKKVKRLLGCVCALTLLLGAIPVDGIEALAEDATETTYYDVLDEDNALQLHGVTYDETAQLFRRMDLATAASIAGISDAVNEGTYSIVNSEGTFRQSVYSHAREAAGGRIRFSTDSSYVSIKATLYNWDNTYAKLMKAGKYGFDVYVDTAGGSTYAGTVSVAEYPADNGEVTVEGTVEFDGAETRNLTIYFPITIETKSVEIGVATDSEITEHTIPYEANQKIVFYGSSITQGGSVSKPGNTYVNTVGRNLNMEYQSYGVWGSAKGQKAFAEYIAETETGMTAFVLDYDHNNNKVSELEDTYYQFYETIREKHQNIPIIMVTRPNNYLDTQNANDPDSYSSTGAMKAFIRGAYDTAVAAGDENVHFVDGETFFNYSKEYLADNVHPNDAGQAKMAEVMTDVLHRAIVGEEKNICEVATKCYLFEENFESGIDTDKWTIGNSSKFTCETINDSICQLQYKTTSSDDVATTHIRNKTAILQGSSDYVVEMDHLKLFKTDEKWSRLGLMFRQPGTPETTLEFRIQPATNGINIMPYYNGDRYDEVEGVNVQVSDNYDSTQYIKIRGMKEMFESGEYDLDLRVNVEGMGTETIKCTFTVGDQVASITIQNFKISPTALRLFLRASSNTSSDVAYKAEIDNIRVYTGEHTLEAKEKVPATTEATGLKAHYECAKCGKKFLDSTGLNEATSANLVIEKCSFLYSEDFTLEDGENIDDTWNLTAKNTTENDFGVMEQVDGDSVYQLAYRRPKKTTAVYIENKDAILQGFSDYTVEMDVSLYNGTIIEGSTVRWTQLGLLLMDANGKGYEVRFVPNAKGCRVYIYDQTATKAVSLYDEIVEDTDLKNMYTEGEAISFPVRVVVDNYVDDDGVSKIKLSVYVNDNEAVVHSFQPIENYSPNNLRIHVHGGSNSDTTDFKALVDDIEVSALTHTPQRVEKVSSTETTQGTKEHYQCEKCDQKFWDSDAKNAVADDKELKYAALNEIKCQTRTFAATETTEASKDIRFVVYIDELDNYKSVKFEITSGDWHGSAEYKDAYSAVMAGRVEVTPAALYGEAGYFAAVVLKNNPESTWDEPIDVTVTWTLKDGSTKQTTRTGISLMDSN